MSIQPTWLGITEQQFDIFKIIYELNIKMRNLKAKDIITEYNNQFHSDIKRQNLFNQLKILIEKGLIKKDNNFSYIVNQINVENTLNENKKLKEKELKEFGTFLADFKTQLNSLLNIPRVTYLDPTVYMETLSNLIGNSSVMYADSPFPNLSYSKQFYSGLDRKNFVESMKLNCLKFKKLKIYYLTNLTIDLSFIRALKVFQSPIKAYRECQNSIERLQKQITIFSNNLEVRFMEVLPGPHMYIFENDEPKNVILSLRGSNIPHGIKQVKTVHDPYGGIHLVSNRIAGEAKRIFIDYFNKAVPLKGEKATALFDKIRENLDNLYKNLKTD